MISMPHILLTLAVVVLVFGSKKLKDAGGDIGAAINNFKKSMHEGEHEKPPETIRQDKRDSLKQDDLDT